jgi:uncharacterized protein YukE
MAILIDSARADEVCQIVKNKSSEMAAAASQLKSAADPSGWYEGEGASAYSTALENYVSRQNQLDEAVGTLADIINRFTTAVREGDEATASSVLNTGI